MPRSNVAQRIAEKVEPAVMAIAKDRAGHQIQRLLGFWMCWHNWGGMEAMLASGHWAQSNLYKQRAEFREVFGVDVAACYPATAAAWRRELGRSA